MFASCLTYAAYSITSSFEEWTSDPLSTGIEVVPTVSVPFPQVTICPSGEKI